MDKKVILGLIFALSLKILFAPATMVEVIALGLLSAIIISHNIISKNKEIEQLRKDFNELKDSTEKEQKELALRLEEVKDVKSYLSALKGGTALKRTNVGF